jgi:hypothetical protein
VPASEQLGKSEAGGQFLTYLFDRPRRQQLMEYYAGSGHSDPLQIALPKGGYRITFITQNPPAAAPASSASRPWMFTQTDPKARPSTR